MARCSLKIRALLLDERGAALVDYSIVLAVFSMMMLGAMSTLQGQTATNLSHTESAYAGLSSSP